MESVCAGNRTGGSNPLASAMPKKTVSILLRDKMNEEIIQIKGLTKRYGYGDTESFALKDFDLTIRRGEFIMIMGPSGLRDQ